MSRFRLTISSVLHTRIAGALLLALILVGCGAPTKPALYTGPTEPIYDVLGQINANNAAIPTLWARHYFEATVVDENKKSHFVNGEGILLYRAPGEMRLVGKKDLAGTIFELGSTSETFWLQLVPEIDTLWYGAHKNVGKPCMEAMPIRPDLVMQVLGVGTIDTDLNQPPVPVMRFNNDSDAYMLVWNAKLADRWIAQKEIWYDRVSKLPKLVLLFDATGRVVLRAYLSKHKQIELTGASEVNWPSVATEYKLYFPDTGTKMNFELQDITLANKGVPNERSIRLPDLERLLENGTNVRRVDAACMD